MHSSILFGATLYLVLLPGVVVPCMYSADWSPQDFNTRAQEAMTAMPGDGDPPVSLGFSAAIDVRCVYKTPADDRDLGDSITVTPVNFTMSCAKTKMSAGGVYLMFLKRNSEGDGLMPDEVNGEEAQFLPDEEKLGYLVEAFGVGRNGGSPGCPVGDGSDADQGTGGSVDDGSPDRSGPVKDDGDITLAPNNLKDSTPKPEAQKEGPGNGSSDWKVMPIYLLVGIGMIVSGENIY